MAGNKFVQTEAIELKTEEEQLEAIKQWWSDNGLALVATVVVVVGGWFGWQAWQQQQTEKAQAAADLYIDIQQAVINQGVVGGEMSQQELELIRSIGFLTDQMQQEHAGNGFSVLGALAAARAAADRNDYAQAEQRLQWALDNNDDEALEGLLTYRLAIAKYAQENYDEALSLLNGGSTQYAALFAEVRGDGYLQMGEASRAADEYRSAIDALLESQLAYRPNLEAKLAQTGATRAE